MNMTKFIINQKNPYIELTHGDFVLNSKLACFDLDDTIIKVKSKSKFAKDKNDWVFLNDKVKSKLVEMYNDGFSVVIFSNQKGLSNGKQDPDTWISKIELIGNDLKIPFKCFASTDSDIYRKPFPTLFLALTKEKIIDKTSFYCGDAAGRENDFSDTDLKFAVNCGLDFKLPENLWLNQKVVVPPVSYNVDFKKIIKNKEQKIKVNGGKEMIIMVGFPGSGKSTIVQNQLEPAGFVRINMDTLKTKDKCIKECEKNLKLDKPVVIDNTNPDVETRKIYIDLAKKYGYTVRCVIVDCPREVAIHNANYRSFVSNGKTKIIRDMVYNIYKSKHKTPDIKEGFTEIISVPNNCPDDKRYFYYLS